MRRSLPLLVHVEKLSTCFSVLFISVLSQVSTGGRHSKKTQSLLSCNRKVLNMAENMPAIHLQFTEYYFPHSAEGPGTSVVFICLFILSQFVCDNTDAGFRYIIRPVTTGSRSEYGSLHVHYVGRYRLTTT